MSNWEFETTGPILFDLSVASGRIEIDTTTSDQVHIWADDPERITIDHTGLTVTVRQPRHTRGRVRVKATIPVGSDVDVAVGSADVSIGSGCSDIDVKGGSGDVRVGDARRVRIAAASGDMRIGSVAEDLTVSGASGDIMVDDAGRDLAVSAASGDVRIGHIGGSASVSTASGDVRIRRFDGTAVEVRSLSGDLEIGLPGGIRVEADIKSLVGKISLPQPAAAGDEPRRTVRLKARTTSGDIRIERI